MSAALPARLRALLRAAGERVPPQLRGALRRELAQRGIFQPRTRAPAPAAPAGAATLALYERLTADDLRAVDAALAPAERSRWEAASEDERKALALAFGVHHELPGVLERTGLRSVAPPTDVHAMAHGAEHAGGGYYVADLVLEGLAKAGVAPRAGSSALDFGCSSGRVVRVLAAVQPDVRWHGC